MTLVMPRWLVALPQPGWPLALARASWLVLRRRPVQVLAQAGLLLHC